MHRDIDLFPFKGAIHGKQDQEGSILGSAPYAVGGVVWYGGLHIVLLA